MKSCRFLWSHQHRSLLLHLSGGTTEFLLCDMDSKGYNLEIVGGTKDISIGQLIDRAGVAMGYPFPSGVYLDQAAKEFSHMGEGFALKDIKVNDGYFNLSGPETAILRKIESSSATEYPAIAYELFDRIAGLLALSIKELTAQYGIGRVYMAGGVASSSFIRSSIRANLPPDGPEIIFGSPALSGDNAVGVARLAHRLSK